MTPAVRLDLHVHSERSPDSRLTLEAIVSGIRAAGLQGFALTDHHTVAGLSGLRALAQRYPDLCLVPGVEVSTAAGHLLAYGVEVAPPDRRPLEETIDWVRAQGGESVLPHPFRWAHGVGRTRAMTANVAAIETINGQNSGSANRAAERLAQDRRLGRTGGSDAHIAEGLGRAYTILEDAPASVDDLLEAIRRNRTRADGRSLTLSGRLRWSIRNTGLRVRRGFRAV